MAIAYEAQARVCNITVSLRGANFCRRYLLRRRKSPVGSEEKNSEAWGKRCPCAILPQSSRLTRYPIGQN